MTLMQGLSFKSRPFYPAAAAPPPLVKVKALVAVGGYLIDKANGSGEKEYKAGGLL